MDFKRVRAVLIAVFLVANIILGALYYNIKKQESDAVLQAQNTLVSFLDEKNIALDLRDVPSRQGAMKNLYIDRTIQSETSFIEKIMGDYYVVSEGNYANDNKTLSIASGGIDFKDFTPKEDKINLSGMSSADIERFCKQNIKKYGISLDNTIFKGTNTSGENKKAIFAYKYDGYEILDAYITVEISSNGITGILGRNIITNGYLVDESIDMIALTDILIEFSNNPALNKSKKTGIIDITQGYYVGKGAEHYKSAIAIPVWQIAADDGNIYHYDARNGSYIE